ncbi:MAG: hypothetical protein JOZ15_05360 [Acidobacteria bacterium]|nr:hypothetical protein [Acidobacteriota bacterium]
MISTMTSPRGRKIQGWSAHYDKWLLSRLIDLGLETSENALVARIVREWIERKAERHAALGLTLEAFLSERQAAGAKLYSFPEAKGAKGPLRKEPEKPKKPKAPKDKPRPEEPEGLRLGIIHSARVG